MMIEDTLESRYAPVQKVLEEQLEEWFGLGNFKIIVSTTSLQRYIASIIIYFADHY